MLKTTTGQGIRALATAGVFGVVGLAGAANPQQVVRADLAYRAPVTGAPSPNFSPKGTQVPLADLGAGLTLPDGAARPAKTGTIRIGPGETSWMRVLATADAGSPKDLCRIYLDRNRNGNFADDGPALAAKPTPREKTGDVWSSFPGTEIVVPYGRGPQGEIAENYAISLWIVRPADGPPPDILRYSVRSWRTGAVTIGGVEALVAAMDSDNNAVFDTEDTWSVLEGSAPDATKKVLSYDEARPTNRLMFVKSGGRELVLEFRAISPDGRALTFAVVDRPVTKAADRAGDDTVREERTRPRATTPFSWGTKLDAALAQAGSSGRKVIVDFWATWCGPCKTMDEWVWSDAELASVLSAGYIGVKLDGDVEKALAERFTVVGYPTMLVLDAAGKELGRAVGYQSSKQMLALVNAKR